jgi:hypothetical protein
LRWRGLDGLPRQQAATAEHQEDDDSDQQIEAQARKEQMYVVAGQIGALHDLIRDASIDAHGREAAALRAMNHHQSHQERMNAVLLRKAQGYRRDDRDSAGTHCADAREQRRDEEHHPGNGCRVAAHAADGLTNQPVDRAVVLRDREQVGDADQRDEQVTRKARQDVGGRHVDVQAADDEGHDERQCTHVDRQRRPDHEQDHQADDACYFRRHAARLAKRFSRRTLC